jgi:hypothetical protein
LVKTFYLLLAIRLICSNVFAEDTNCLREIPVNVVLRDAAIVRKLRPEQFIASIKNEQAPIASVIPDNGPRRIVFVVETAKSNSEAVRRIEAAMVAEIVASARPQDSFALLTAHGPRREVRFGEAHGKLGSVIQELGEAAKGKKEFSGVLDAVQEATGWLQPHHPGDAIVVISSGIEKPPGISYEKVRDELTSAGIRLFGFQLSTFISGHVSTGLAGLPGGLE